MFVTNQSICFVLLIVFRKSFITARQCHKSKCEFNRCYAVGPLESCLCEEGYEAVVEIENPVGFPFLFHEVSYTCCESQNEVRNKESYQCGSSLIPITDAIPDGFEECTWDKCSSNNANTNNVFYHGSVTNFHSHNNASKCVALPGEQCHCSSGYLAKRTGKSTPMHDLLENGEVLYAYQYICCPVPVTRFGMVLSPENFRPENFDGPTCAIPECNSQCLSSDVCFQELGCYTPPNPEEYEGCVANKCNNNWGDIFWTPSGIEEVYTSFGLSCWATHGGGCYCKDGLVAKTTGRTSYTGAAEYVCCPEGTTGAVGVGCNPVVLLGVWWFLLCVLLFPRLFAVFKKVFGTKQKSENLSDSGIERTASEIDLSDSIDVHIVNSLTRMEKDLRHLRDEITDKLKQQEQLMQRFAEMEKQVKEQSELKDNFNKNSEHESSDLLDSQTVQEQRIKDSSNKQDLQVREDTRNVAISSTKAPFDISVSNINSCREFEGIHQYVLHYITDFEWDNHSSSKILGLHFSLLIAPLVSWLVLLLPLYILDLMIIESQFPKCMFGCERSGEVCAGSPDDSDSVCAGVGEVCPYLRHTTKPTPWSTIITCAFAFLYVLSGTIKDIAQNHRATQAATHRFKTKQSNSTLINLWIKFNIWAINLVRGYVIPGATFASTIAILHSANDSLKISSILLNGVAIIIIGEIDDAMGYFFVPPDMQDKVSDEMKAALDASSDAMSHKKIAKGYHNTSWLTDRIMSSIMYVASMYVATCPLDAMLYLLGSTTCGTFMYVQFVPIIIGLGFGAIDSSLHGPSPTWTIIFVEFLINSVFIASLFVIGLGFSAQRAFGDFAFQF